MSGTPNKRPHEETGGHSSSLKYPPHDDSGMYPKLTSSGNNDYRNTPFDAMQDNRMPKIPRSEARDVERRSSLLLPPPSYNRMSSSSLNDSRSEQHSAASENRNDLRDYKDNSSNKGFKAATKVEPRELHQGTKGDDNSSINNIGNKETKCERDPADYNNVEPKDSYSVGGNSHLNWKELKEQHRVKRHPTDNTSPTGNAVPWHSSSCPTTTTTTAAAPIISTNTTTTTPPPATILHGEVGKVATMEDGEAHEAVGQSNVDIKGGGDDKWNEKDRKRKEGKREGGSEKEKERSSDPPRNEEREPEKWEKDRKDVLMKEKDKSKDCMREVVLGAVEKEAEKHADAGAGNDDDAMMEHENSMLLEQKKHHHDREGNTTTTASGDVIEGGGERPEKRSRCYDKESDEGGCIDAAEGGTEREREGVLSCGVQQRKRMPRTRGSPQLGNREPRFHSRASQDSNNEGSQGKLLRSVLFHFLGKFHARMPSSVLPFEQTQVWVAQPVHRKPNVSTVVYKVGECMQELIKSWKEYESQADKMGEGSQTGPTLEIWIPAEHVTATNRQVRGGQLWGTDIYTDDSDLVAVLMHTGYCRPTASPPPPTIQELHATIKVLPPQDCYISTLRNNVRSRAWGAAIGCSYIVQKCCIVKKGGGTIDLEPCLTHASAMEPTLAPVIVERTMTTRAAASNALRQQRFVREVTIQYNLCNEPWIKYSISAVADKGLKKPLYTSARLKKGEVLYLESHSCRYELCFSGEKVAKGMNALETESDASQSHVMNSSSNNNAATTAAAAAATINNDTINNNSNNSSSNGERSTMTVQQVDGGCAMMMDVFRWSRCSKPLPQKVMLSVGIPLPIDHLEVLEENVEWEDIQWSQAGVWISGKEYSLVRVHFLSPN